MITKGISNRMKYGFQYKSTHFIFYYLKKKWTCDLSAQSRSKSVQLILLNRVFISEMLQKKFSISNQWQLAKEVLNYKILDIFLLQIGTVHFLMSSIFFYFMGTFPNGQATSDGNIAIFFPGCCNLNVCLKAPSINCETSTHPFFGYRK